MRGLLTSENISVLQMMDGDRAARPRLRLVGDGVKCPTTREPCGLGCRTICLLPKPDGPGPAESRAQGPKAKDRLTQHGRRPQTKFGRGRGA